MAFASTSDLNDGVNYSGARTANLITFRLLGGKYAWGTSAASSSQTLGVVLADASTLPVTAALTTAAAYTVLDLPPGTYTIAFVATGDVAGFVAKIPYSGGMGF